jgi:hypothetical protein
MGSVNRPFRSPRMTSRLLTLGLLLVRVRHWAKRRNWMWDTSVERDGDSGVAAVYSGMDGKTLPQAFTADGILVGLDPMYPGRLLVGRNVDPNFRFTAQGERIDCRMNVGRRAELLARRRGPPQGSASEG